MSALAPTTRQSVWSGPQPGAATLAQLAQDAGERPGLKDLLPFWGALYRVQIEAREGLSAAGALRWALRRERLEAGLPQLHLGDLPLQAEAVAGLAGRLEDAWLEHDPAEAPCGPQDWLALVGRSFADPTLMPGQRGQLDRPQMLSALALVPYLEWAAEGVVAAAEVGPEAWNRGQCPVCGGYPDLAILDGASGGRTLACSRCSTTWPFQRVGCPFCRDTERQAYHAGDDGAYRLYVCGHCRRYLKTVDAQRRGGPLDPRVERLITIGMDLAALEAGYGPQ